VAVGGKWAAKRRRHNEKSKHGNNGDYNKMPATIATTIESSNNKGKKAATTAKFSLLTSR